MKKLILLNIFLFFIISNIFGQETIEVKTKNFEGVIFCRDFYSKRYLKVYNVFDIHLEQVKIFEKKLQANGKIYKNYVRQYHGLIKNNEKLLVAKLIKKVALKSFPNWKKEEYVVIDGCATRIIAYNIKTKKIIQDKSPMGCNE